MLLNVTRRLCRLFFRRFESEAKVLVDVHEPRGRDLSNNVTVTSDKTRGMVVYEAGTDTACPEAYHAMIEEYIALYSLK